MYNVLLINIITMENNDVHHLPLDKGLEEDKINTKEWEIHEMLSLSKQMPYIHYCQNTWIWCWVASFLMALSWIKKWYIPNMQDEVKLINELAKASDWIALWSIMKLIDSHNIKMDVFSANKMENLNPDSSLVINYKDTIQNLLDKWSIIYQEGMQVDIWLVASELQKWRYIIMHGTIGWINHIRMVVWYEWDMLLVADPLYNKILKYNKDDFEENFTPPYGKRFISLYV